MDIVLGNDGEKDSKQEPELRYMRVLRTLSACSRVVIRATDEMQLLDEICRTMVKVGGYSLSWIGYAIDDDNKTVMPMAKVGFEVGNLGIENVSWSDDRPEGNGAFGNAIRSGKPVMLTDTQNSPDMEVWHESMLLYQYHTVLCLPLFANGTTIGAIGFYSPEPNRFDAQETELLMEVASDLSYGISVIRLRKARDEAEAQLEKANLVLEQRVRERTVQLESLNKELETFNYSVSHDLRAPLRRIKGFMEILRQDHVYTENPVSSQLMLRIQESAEHMEALINALLNLARFSFSDLQKKSVDLSAVVHRIAAELQQNHPTRQVEMVIAEGIKANGDDQLLGIVLDNLLSNAWRFTTRRTPARIEFGMAPQTDGSTAYFVRDNGAGFEMGSATKLFGAFQRFHSEKEFPGIGIGLATVQRIIHRHGGRVWADATLDKGATFYFTIGQS